MSTAPKDGRVVQLAHISGYLCEGRWDDAVELYQGKGHGAWMRAGGTHANVDSYFYGWRPIETDDHPEQLPKKPIK